MKCPNCGNEAVSYWRFINTGIYMNIECKNCNIILRPYKSLWYQVVYFMCILINCSASIYLSDYLAQNIRYFRVILMLIILFSTASVTFFFLWKYWKLSIKEVE